MAQVNALLTTGLTGLDRMLKGLIPGDNIVWQVYSIDDYVPFVAPYCRAALERGERLIYFRFAKHPPLVAAGPGVSTYELHPEAGFEAFIAQIHSIIERTGQGGYYVFDCLSDLAVEWYSDQMLGNFFLLTCPCLYDMEAIAYFSLLRNFHSAHAVTPISETAQVLIDVYRHGGRLYVHPTKVQQRYSPTMNMLHVWDADDFAPVTESSTIAEILTSVPRLQLDAASYRLGVWNRTFFEAEEAFEEARRGDIPIAKADEFFPRLMRMAVSRDERVLRLAEKHFTLADVLEVRRRMIGTGLIGGKSVGMLLARAILREIGRASCRERV
jgi:pyruvate,water dikinase